MWISREDGPERQTLSEGRGPRKGQGARLACCSKGCEEREPGTEGIRKGTGPEFMGLRAHMPSLLRDSVAPWTPACRAPLSMGFSRHGYWSGSPFPAPGALPDPGMESASPVSPALADGLFTTSTTWEALHGPGRATIRLRVFSECEGNSREFSFKPKNNINQTYTGRPPLTALCFFLCFPDVMFFTS